MLAVWPATATSVAVLVPSAATTAVGDPGGLFGLARTLQEVTQPLIAGSATQDAPRTGVSRSAAGSRGR